MKKIYLIMTGVCVFGLLAPSVAFAKDKKPDVFAQYDVNHNGVLDPDEIAAIRKDYAADPDGPLKAFDKNNDGKLDDDEIAAIKPHKHKKKKKDEDAPAAAAPDASAPTDKPAAPDAPAATATDSTAPTDSNGNK
ncbi:MAG TPA: hypothetical protein VNW23_08420 [Opitutaceae bacterium]|jgi:hypothetical protein|nr:hypothetical protein [Opitutaceae bacterium]